MPASHSFTRKTRATRNVWSISRDHVLYDDIRYLIPILNSIEEEDEYRRGCNKESNSDSLLLSNRDGQHRAEKEALMPLSGYNRIGNLMLYPLPSTDPASKRA